MIKDYQLNNIYLIKVRVQTLEHKCLLNIVSSQNTNDYCRTNDTKQRNIRSRKTTLERIQLMKSKIYVMKNMAFDHLLERWLKGMVVTGGSTKMTNCHLSERSPNALQISIYGTEANDCQIRHSTSRKFLPTKKNMKKVALYTYNAGKWR